MSRTCDSFSKGSGGLSSRRPLRTRIKPRTQPPRSAPSRRGPFTLAPHRAPCSLSQPNSQSEVVLLVLLLQARPPPLPRLHCLLEAVVLAEEVMLSLLLLLPRTVVARADRKAHLRTKRGNTKPAQDPGPNRPASNLASDLASWLYVEMAVVVGLVC
mmetsp:Transcript_71267/g.140003  ORF Transcript_71267/g.140003 Transcript_71267/m.140003 type:complete len:157 (+) Transcript_71267:261-731(+)